MNDEFNVGDEVKIVDEFCSYSTYSDWASKYKLTAHKGISRGFKTGDTAKIIVKAPHSAHSTVTLYGLLFCDGEHGIMAGRGLELIEKEEKAMSIEVGDLVEVLSVCAGPHDYEVGEIGVVYAKYGDDHNASLVLEGHRGFSMRESRFKLLSRTPDKAAFTADDLKANMKIVTQTGEIGIVAVDSNGEKTIHYLSIEGWDYPHFATDDTYAMPNSTISKVYKLPVLNGDFLSDRITRDCVLVWEENNEELELIDAAFAASAELSRAKAVLKEATDKLSKLKKK